MYFKSPEGHKGYTNSSEFMLRLKEHGYIRLTGRELFVHIVLQALRTWGVPAVVALVAYELMGEFVIGLVIFCFVQSILD